MKFLKDVTTEKFIVVLYRLYYVAYKYAKGRGAINTRDKKRKKSVLLVCHKAQWFYHKCIWQKDRKKYLDGIMIMMESGRHKELKSVAEVMKRIVVLTSTSSCL